MQTTIAQILQVFEDTLYSNTGVEISDETLVAPAGNGDVASDGIISYFPEFSQFGDFRNGINIQNLFCYCFQLSSLCILLCL